MLIQKLEKPSRVTVFDETFLHLRHLSFIHVRCPPLRCHIPSIIVQRKEGIALGPTRTKVVYFDLDGTLFDHDHSLQHAISAIRKRYTALAERTVEELIEWYNASHQQAYDAYLDKVIPYEEADTRKIRLFFASLGLPEPSLEEVQQFRDAYEAVYRANRRTTAGSVEALVRLREHGYYIGIITNGQVQDQTDKAKAIGILHLTDRIITSEEAGYRKPDRRIFQYAVEQLGLNSFEKTYMIGDSADSDIKGALDAQLAAIMYSPTAQDSQRLLFGQQIPVIKHLAQLLGHLSIASPRFTPRFVSASGRLVVEGIGIDMVTEPQRCLHISKGRLRFLSEKMGAVLDCAAHKYHKQAVFHIESMIGAITKATDPNDEEITQSRNGRRLNGIRTAHNCLVTERDHSMRVVYVRLNLYTASEDKATLREMVSLLQEHCNDLMRDDPGAAVHKLHGVMQILAERAGI